MDFGIVPDAVIGDLDSISGELRSRLADRIVHVSEQETNDLTKAFKAATETLPEVIHILGATGRREDHTLGNVSLLADYAAELVGSSCSIDMVTETGVFHAFCDSEIRFSCPVGREVSIFAFDNSLQIKSEGLLYSTDRVTFDTLWKATLNCSIAETVSLHLSHQAKVIVFISNPD